MAEVGDLYPGTGERVVAKVKNPDGPGFWLQGEYGGVFAEGGAPYLGSDFDPNMAQHRNDPNRRFSGMVAEGGGYRSISANAGEGGYAFNPKAVAPGATAAPVQAPAEQRANAPGAASAKGLVATLVEYGLPASLADTLWDNEYIRDGKPINTIISVTLPNTNEYKARFPALGTLTEKRNRGEAVLVPTVEQYVQLEQGIGQVLKDAGLPADFYNDPTDFAAFIGGSTSPKEVLDRVDAARTLLYETPMETREELARVYDMDEGEAVAWILDPARGKAEVQKRITGAGIGGASKRSGWGLLTRAEMEQLAGSGVTEGEAEQRTGVLAQMGEGLFAETAGEEAAGDRLGRDTQIGFVAGSGTAEADMQRRRQRRKANFEGGGGAATGGGGRTGLG